MTMLERLGREFSLEPNFRKFCQSIQDEVPIQQAGIAVLSPDATTFRVATEWFRDKRDNSRRSSTSSRDFARVGTVGDLVLRAERSFVGRTIDAVATFPGTAATFEAEGYQSNYVARLQDRHGAVAFFLSKEADGFNPTNQSALDNVLSQLNLIFELGRLTTPAHQRRNCLVDELRAAIERIEAITGHYPTLKEVEEAYLLQIARGSHFRVEGVLGASAQSGIKPSTLRYRLAQLENDDGF